MEDRRDFLMVAWGKGKLANPCRSLLEKAGYRLDSQGRNLLMVDSDHQASFMELRAHDAVSLLDQGLVDVALVGKDTLLERKGDFLELMDLGIGRCRLCLAGPQEIWGEGADWQDRIRDLGLGRRLRIATSYPLMTEAFCRQSGIEALVIGLSGSVELAPALGIADLVTDLVSTGRTLAENGLVELKEIRVITARVAASRGALHLKARQIEEFTRRLRAALSEGG